MFSQRAWALSLNGAPGHQFRRIDSILDRAAQGPVWLTEPRVAECATSIIERGARGLGQYRLHAFVVMANHVHVLITPLCSVARLTKGLKGTSARECNEILGRTENRFWQDESFDHWVRTNSEFNRTRAYIEQNPVAAGLVKTPGDWPWSSVTRRVSLS